MAAVDSATRLDPRQFDGELEWVLAELWNAKQGEDGNAWRSAGQVSRALLDDFGLSVHWRTIDALLSRHKDKVKRRKRSGRWEYVLLVGGDQHLGRAQSPIVLIDPAEALQATVALHDLLGSLKGDIRLCDPYLDAKTMEHLDACPSSSRLSLLTQNVRDSGRLRSLLSAAQGSMAGCDVRVAPPKTLHDRYLIDDEGMIILGTSLNGFGKKQSFLIRAGADFAVAMGKEFDRIWASGTPWP